MTKKRSNYIYKFAGKIINRWKRISDKNKPYFYQLDIDNENIDKIFVFQKKLQRNQIWQDIEQSNYLGKKYGFSCKNYMGNYGLIDWQELKDYE